MEEGINLFHIYQVIIKRWYLVIFLPLLLAGSLYIYSSYNYTPVYTAKATLMVTRSAGSAFTTSSDVHLSRTLVATYQEIAKSRRILNLVASDDMIPYSADGLYGKVRVEGVGTTELIEISATDLDPVLASYIANMTSRVFMDQIGEVIRGSQVTILDEAPVPRGPSNRPGGVNHLVAVLIGLAGAVGLAFFFDYLDQSIKERDEAEKLLGLPVLGFVPRVSGKGEVTVSGRSPQAESIRTLRTNLQFISADKPIRRILVTGANPSCDKSTISANLAMTMAQAGNSVLLLDADLRRPTQQRIFNVEMEPGLSSLVFNSDLLLHEVLQESGKDNLQVLTCGPIPPYPAEMLSSQRMKELVRRLSEQFDYLIFDSPPVLAVTDAVVLSSLVDATLLVLDYGRVKRGDAVETMKQLERVQAKVVGSVLNNVPYSSSYYNGYKNYYSAKAN